MNLILEAQAERAAPPLRAKAGWVANHGKRPACVPSGYLGGTEFLGIFSYPSASMQMVYAFSFTSADGLMRAPATTAPGDRTVVIWRH